MSSTIMASRPGNGVIARGRRQRPGCSSAYTSRGGHTPRGQAGTYATQLKKKGGAIFVRGCETYNY